MSTLTYEHCCVCDERTGKGGRSDGSLYLGDDGPYCNACYDKQIELDHRQAKAAQELANVLGKISRSQTFTLDEVRAALAAFEKMGRP